MLLLAPERFSHSVALDHRLYETCRKRGMVADQENVYLMPADSSSPVLPTHGGVWGLLLFGPTRPSPLKP
jgi:hypothetical protein